MSRPGTGVEARDRLLAILDPDSARAETSYQELRSRLVRFLSWKGSAAPEDAAQEALVRGFRRILEGAEVTAVDPRSYFIGIAKNVLREEWRSRKDESLEWEEWENIPSADRTIESINAQLTLERCLRCLSEPEQTLYSRYHDGGRRDREDLARELGITLDNLRVKVHRISRRARRLAPVLREGTGRKPE